MVLGWIYYSFFKVIVSLQEDSHTLWILLDLLTLLSLACLRNVGINDFINACYCRSEIIILSHS